MADKSDLVSIIIPVFNIENRVGKCLQSVAAQSYCNLEILVLDDGSTDHSLAVCQMYADHDSRIRCFHHKNHGVSYTRNRGILESVGKYLLFIDGGDEIETQMVENYISSFSSEIDVVVGGITMVERDGKFIKVPEAGLFGRREFLEHVCYDTSGIYGYAPNKMYRSRIIKGNDIRFREDMAAQEDLEFALSVYAAAKKIRCIEDTGYLYYHSAPKREMPIKDLLGNQIKLYRIASSAGSNTKGVVKRLQNYVYTTIIRAESKSDIIALYEVPMLTECLSINEPVSIEMRVVNSLFIKRRPESLFYYSKFRKRIKKVLRKETI